MPTLTISWLFGSYAVTTGSTPSQGLLSVIVGSVVAIVAVAVYSTSPTGSVDDPSSS